MQCNGSSPRRFPSLARATTVPSASPDPVARTERPGPKAQSLEYINILFVTPFILELCHRSFPYDLWTPWPGSQRRKATQEKYYPSSVSHECPKGYRENDSGVPFPRLPSKSRIWVAYTHKTIAFYTSLGDCEKTSVRVTAATAEPMSNVRPFRGYLNLATWCDDKHTRYDLRIKRRSKVAVRRQSQ